ncbi:hypothetical protein ACSBR1_016182 [Camellia fascicularis]
MSESEHRLKQWRFAGDLFGIGMKTFGDFFGNDGRFTENLFVCFDFQIENCLRMVSKSEPLRRSACVTRVGESS